MTVNACISVKEELVMPFYDVVFHQKYWDDILWQRTIPASDELMVATPVVCGIEQGCVGKQYNFPWSTNTP